MKMYSKMKLIGIEQKVSKKGNAYTTLLLADGTETLNAMFEGQQDLVGLPVYADYKVEIDYNTRYKSMKVTKLEKVEAK